MILKFLFNSKPKKVKKLKSKSIKHFVVEGVAVDQEAILRLKRELEDRLVDMMREKGWVPVIDLLPQMYWDYDQDVQNFRYEIVIYGSFVGKQNSRKILGYLDSRPIMMENTDGSGEPW